MVDGLSDDLMKDLTRQFEAMLSEVRYDYQKNLQEINALDKEALEKMLTVFSQRLIIFQHTFMERLSQARGGVGDPHTMEFVIETPHLDPMYPRIRLLDGVIIRIFRRKQRKRIREALMAKFDEDIAPSLRTWAHDKITAE